MNQHCRIKSITTHKDKWMHPYGCVRRTFLYYSKGCFEKRTYELKSYNPGSGMVRAELTETSNA